MDMRDISYDHEIYSRCKDRKHCVHSETDLIVDVEVVQISPLKFEIYEYRKCPYGCYYRVFTKTHIISEDTLKTMYG